MVRQWLGITLQEASVTYGAPSLGRQEGTGLGRYYVVYVENSYLMKTTFLSSLVTRRLIVRPLELALQHSTAIDRA